MKRALINLCFITFILSFLGCDKDDNSSANGNTLLPGTLNVEFVNKVDSLDLDITGNTNYQTSIGETFSVNVFKYYASNIRLIKSDSSRYYLPNTYWLMNAENPQSLLKSLNNVAAGKYIGIEFMIGVDSTTLSQGVQSGDLDPSNGMIWSWTTGYIFLKMEGRCPTAGTDSLFQYHISGYHDYDGTNALRWATIYFNGQTINVNKSVNTTIQIKADLQEFFKNPSDWSISDSPFVTSPGHLPPIMADNYKDMFSFVKVN
ncbi:MAG: MbnP family protein [Bacteroidota bacterium]